jgi:hypothetical protein
MSDERQKIAAAIDGTLRRYQIYDLRIVQELTDDVSAVVVSRDTSNGDELRDRIAQSILANAVHLTLTEANNYARIALKCLAEVRGTSNNTDEATSDYERGAREAAEAMVLYFQDEDERSMVGQRVENRKRGRGWSWRNIEDAELVEYAEGAIQDAMRWEKSRLDHIASVRVPSTDTNKPTDEDLLYAYDAASNGQLGDIRGVRAVRDLLSPVSSGTDRETLAKTVLSAIDANTDQARLSDYGDVAFTTDIDELAGLVADAVIAAGYRKDLGQ